MIIAHRSRTRHHRRGCSHKLWRNLRLRPDVVLPRLRSQHPFCRITVPLAFTVLLVGVLNRNLLIHEILPVHVGDSSVRRLEIGKGHKTISFGHVLFISGNLHVVSFVRGGNLINT